MAAVRQVAFNIINKTLNGNSSLNEIFRSSVNGLMHEDIAAIKEISYGTVRYKIQLDYMITSKTGKRISEMNKSVRNIIRMSVYQLDFMNKKEYAVVNEAVILTEQIHERSKGFVNWILREYLRSSKPVQYSSDKNGLSHRYSFPIEFIEYLINRVGIAKTEELLAFYNEQYNASIFNIRDGSFTLYNSGIELSDDEYIMDPIYLSIMSAMKDLNVNRILDCCSAPGGKTILLRHLFPEAMIYANDIDADRLEKVRTNVKRMHLNDIRCTNEDFLHYEFDSLFDLIVIDAPCTATGTIRKNPDVKYKYRRKIANLTDIQMNMMERADEFIQDEGYILYMTCSVLKEENQEIIDKYLKKNKMYSLQWEYFTFGNPNNGAYGALLKKKGG